jgi:hypothetical protein
MSRLVADIYTLRERRVRAPGQPVEKVVLLKMVRQRPTSLSPEDQQDGAWAHPAHALQALLGSSLADLGTGASLGTAASQP